MSKSTETKTDYTTHMAQPTNAVSRSPSASVSANSQSGLLRVSAAPSVSVRRCLGKAFGGRKKKKHLPRKISGNPLQRKGTLDVLGCRSRAGLQESGVTPIRAAPSAAGLRFPDQD
jgi:hypothetical protein